MSSSRGARAERKVHESGPRGGLRMMQRTPNASTRSGLHPCLRLSRVRLRHFRSARSFSGATRTKGLSSSTPAASPSTHATFLECVCSPRVRLRLSPKRQKHPIVCRCRNMRLPAKMRARRRLSMCQPTSEHTPTGQRHAPADVGTCAYRAETYARRRQNMCPCAVSLLQPLEIDFMALFFDFLSRFR